MSVPLPLNFSFHASWNASRVLSLYVRVQVYMNESCLTGGESCLTYDESAGMLLVF